MNKKAISYMYDGQKLSNLYMDNVTKFKEFMNLINEKHIKGSLTIIPYFEGKVKEDSGITGCIVGNGKHFTCHTFCYKGNVYIDCFNILPVNYEELEKEVKNHYSADNYNEYFINESNKISFNKQNKFGKHLILKTNNDIEIEIAKTIINKLLIKINMTPIHDLIINKHDLGYDLLQIIAESHISCHKKNNLIYFDIFSCNDFSTKDVQEIFKSYEYNLTEVIRKK